MQRQATMAVGATGRAMSAMSIRGLRSFMLSSLQSRTYSLASWRSNLNLSPGFAALSPSFAVTKNPLHALPSAPALPSAGRSFFSWLGGQKDGASKDFSQEEAKKAIDGGGILLDVRRIDEFYTGHAKIAVNIPHEVLGARINEVHKLTQNDFQKAIVVHCRSGARSAVAKRILEENGYKNVLNLGGISDVMATFEMA
ncbi:hypothetical protein GUITHDRAFT_88190 [Guillardia theta CCMP2712]|uniref:Rhodanese domain-containing protein n=1 Tax=Guillardia theta (strain CCMP2712) TaxID=905079 RepID=L1J272_GUITC|nr:hypothetical protein GUITHDRAFT_88190 [Guillardia theta CCMP2712]EKX42229.1 hypothetical protein GUITHDRAFT_88190 [Guillardia theta CCMP2712]|eukprot:XP_005829209.1 hypothetical protein GUITHDRAFT_88190 [Guillardia theta CCMP2712]